jgi:hypothetical protein
MTLLTEPTRYAPPEDIFLGFDAFAGKIETLLAEPP